MSEAVKREAAGGDVALLVGRILLAAIFIPAGYRHLTESSGFAGYLDAHGVPFSSVVAVAAACVEFSARWQFSLVLRPAMPRC